MWPFSKKFRYPGVKENADGTIDFSLTQEEAREADTALKAFEGYVVHPEAAEKLRNGAMAVALCRYAKDMVGFNCTNLTEAEVGSRWSVIRDTLQKAIAAVWKSYSLHALPIFLYHRASFLRFLGQTDEAARLIAQFLCKQSEFRPDQIDEALMKWEGTDITNAIAVAKSWSDDKS